MAISQIMSNENNNSDRKGCLIFALIAFGLAAFKPLMGLIMGTSTDELYSSVSYDPNTGEASNDIEYMRTCFIVFIIALIIYLYPYIKKIK